MNKRRLTDRCDVAAELLSVIHTCALEFGSFPLNSDLTCIFFLLLWSRVLSESRAARYIFLIAEIDLILYGFDIVMECNKIYLCRSHNSRGFSRDSCDNHRSWWATASCTCRFPVNTIQRVSSAFPSRNTLDRGSYLLKETHDSLINSENSESRVRNLNISNRLYVLKT